MVISFLVLISECVCDVKKIFGDGMTGTAVFFGSWISIREPHLVGENKGSVCSVYLLAIMIIIFLVNWFLFLFMQVLGEKYAAIRRTRGDGNCFFRSFMFSYLVCPNVHSLFIPVFWVYTPKLLLGASVPGILAAK